MTFSDGSVPAHHQKCRVGRKTTTRWLLMRSGSPVWGLRPRRSALFRSSNVPNPVSLTVFPSRTVWLISPVTKPRASRTAFRERSLPPPKWFRVYSTISLRFKEPPPFFFCVLFPVLECLCFFFSNGASLSCGRIKSKAVLSGRVAILKIWIPTNKQIFPQYFQAVGSMTALKPGPGEMEPDSRASGVGDASPLANMTLAGRPSQNPA